MSQLPDTYERIRVPPTRTWHTWVLSDHYEPVSTPRGRQRTFLGDLIYRSKYYDDKSALEALVNAIRHCVRQLHRFPPQADALAAVTAVTAVPCYPPKVLSVPHEIAKAAAAELGVPDISPSVVKTRETGAAKMSPSLRPDAYQVRGRVVGEHVLIVDDLYRTGATLESVASQVRVAGAERIVGLCVTKAHKGMSS